MNKTSISLIGEAMRTLRSRLGVTHAELGDMLGLKKLTIHNLEKSVRSPSAGTISAVARFLGISEEAVITGLDQQTLDKQINEHVIPKREEMIDIADSLIKMGSDIAAGQRSEYVYSTLLSKVQDGFDYSLVGIPDLNSPSLKMSHQERLTVALLRLAKSKRPKKLMY